MTLRHWVVRGGTPKHRDEVNRREVCECDGGVCDFNLRCDGHPIYIKHNT
jgi:hypothetical protein